MIRKQLVIIFDWVMSSINKIITLKWSSDAEIKKRWIWNIPGVHL